MKVHTFCVLLFQNKDVWNRDIDKMVSNEMLDILASQTLTPISRIKSTTLRSYEGKLYLKHNPNGHTRWILSYGIYHRERTNYGLVYCPLCLKRDLDTPYFRKHWRLAFYTICTICGVYMHEKCPSCSKPIVLFRHDLGKKNSLAEQPLSHCYNCSFDLTLSEPISAPIKQTRSQRMIMRILREGWKRDIIYPHLFFDVFYQIIKLAGSERKCYSLLQNDLRKRRASATELPKISQGRFLFEKLPIEYRALLIDHAIWLLNDFPRRFIEVLKYHNLKSSDILRDSQNLPFWFFSVVESNFYFSNTNRRFVEYSTRRDTGYNSVIAPITGYAGGNRKLNTNFSCPRCGSNWIIKNGKRNGATRLKCRACVKHFTNTYNFG